MECAYRKWVEKLEKSNCPKGFFWNILGSLSSAAVSVILLFIVTRALNSTSADIYSFAYAIANLFVIVASFQVRDFQATDIREKVFFWYLFHYKAYFKRRNDSSFSDVFNF